MEILKEFKEPTDVVISGVWIEDKEQCLSITDDEASVDVIINSKRIYLTTCGYLYIDSIENIPVDKIEEESGMDALVLKNYKGTISISFKDYNGNVFIGKGKFNPFEYLQDQEYTEDSERWVDPIITVDNEVGEIINLEWDSDSDETPLLTYIKKYNNGK